MKRFFALVLIAVMLLTLVGCEIRINGLQRPSNNGGDTAATIAPTMAPNDAPMPTEPVVETIAPTEPIDPTESVTTQPATCPHSYSDATCDAPAKCTLCGEIKGEALGHSYEGGDCATAGKCSRCGKTDDKPTGHTDGYGGKCTVCGTKTERYYDIQDALKRTERYPKYMNINYDLICTQYDLFNMTKDPQYFTKVHENTLQIYEYLKKVVDLCEDYKELDMLTKECRELVLEMPIVPGSSTTSAMRSYISDAKGFARDASRISIIYNVLCKNYELPGV